MRPPHRVQVSTASNRRPPARRGSRRRRVRAVRLPGAQARVGHQGRAACPPSPARPRDAGAPEDGASPSATRPVPRSPKGEGGGAHRESGSDHGSASAEAAALPPRATARSRPAARPGSASPPECRPGSVPPEGGRPPVPPASRRCARCQSRLRRCPLAPLPLRRVLWDALRSVLHVLLMFVIPKAGAVDDDDMAVVDQAVDQGRRSQVVPQVVAP